MNSIICHNLIDLTKEGMTLESGNKKIYISFDDCVKNFSLEEGKEFCKCVGTRDITTLTFTLYTQPKTSVVFKRSFLKDLIAGESAVSKFLKMQKAIVDAGYTSYDLSQAVAFANINHGDKYRCCTLTAFVSTIPETVKGLGLS